LPSALLMHVPYEVFWHLNPRKLKPFEKAYEMDMDARQGRMNLEAWLHGLYVQNAVGSILSKNAKYPKKPHEIFGSKRKKTPQEEGMDFLRYVEQFNAQRRNKPITK